MTLPLQENYVFCCLVCLNVMRTFTVWQILVLIFNTVFIEIILKFVDRNFLLHEFTLALGDMALK